MMLYKLKLAACFGIPEASGTCIKKNKKKSFVYYD